jgi:hypothetical protein
MVRRDTSALRETRNALAKAGRLLITSSILKDRPLKDSRMTMRSLSPRETTASPTRTGETGESVVTGLNTIVRTGRRDTTGMIALNEQIAVIPAEATTTDHSGTMNEGNGVTSGRSGVTSEGRGAMNAAERGTSETINTASKRGTEEKAVSKIAEATKASSLTSRETPMMTSPGSRNSTGTPRETRGTIGTRGNKDPGTPRSNMPLDLPLPPNPIPMLQNGSPRTN